jgi:predicted  nucleic acid-binding Zn-ribbon protein
MQTYKYLAEADYGHFLTRGKKAIENVQAPIEDFDKNMMELIEEINALKGEVRNIEANIRKAKIENRRINKNG